MKFGHEGRHRIHPGGTGVQWLFQFPNWRGASVVRTPYTYGGSQGLWELAVLNEDGELDYSTPITTDVIGGLDEKDIEGLLSAIAALPPERDEPETHEEFEPYDTVKEMRGEA